MKNLYATVVNIQSCDSLHIVQFDLQGLSLKMMSLDLSSSISIGKKVLLTCKPSSVAIAKNLSGELSYSNQIPTTIEAIEEGILLCNIKLRFGEAVLESIITKDSCETMKLKLGENITALIKASELSILEVYDD